MANAKKLTEPQIAALRAAARGEDPWTAAKSTYLARFSRPGAVSRSSSVTIWALERRGLLEPAQHYPTMYSPSFTITPAGRHALFEATGENTAKKEPIP